jgi:hypothetical protein
MPRTVVLVLALIAGGWSTAAFSQSDNFSGGTMPTLILPGQMTSPMTTGPTPENNVSDPAAWGYQSPGGASEQPYSVDGEEQLEPGTN